MTESAPKYISTQIASKIDHSPGYSSLYNYSMTSDHVSVPSISQNSDQPNLTGNGSFVGRGSIQNISSSFIGRRGTGYGTTSGYLPPSNGGIRSSIGAMEPIEEFQDDKKVGFNRFKSNPIYKEFNGRDADQIIKKHLSPCFLSPNRSSLSQLTEVCLV